MGILTACALFLGRNNLIRRTLFNKEIQSSTGFRLVNRCASNTPNYFENSRLSQVYSLHRHSVAPQVVDEIMFYLSEKLSGPYQNALDVGCGTGLSTRILAPFFQRVTGSDISDTQLYQACCNAANPKHVRYEQMHADFMLFEHDSLQLITAGSSLHYFNNEYFFIAASIMLQLNGVLAVYLLDRPYICGKTQQETDNIKNIIRSNREEMYSRFWDKSLKDLHNSVFTDNQYCVDLRGFDDQRREVITTETDGISLNSVVYWEATMPEYYNLVDTVGEDVAVSSIMKFKENILKELKIKCKPDGDVKVRVGFVCTLVVGRKLKHPGSDDDF